MDRSAFKVVGKAIGKAVAGTVLSAALVVATGSVLGLALSLNFNKASDKPVAATVHKEASSTNDNSTMGYVSQPANDGCKGPAMR